MFEPGRQRASRPRDSGPRVRFLSIGRSLRSLRGPARMSNGATQVEGHPSVRNANSLHTSQAGSTATTITETPTASRHRRNPGGITQAHHTRIPRAAQGLADIAAVGILLQRSVFEAGPRPPAAARAQQPRRHRAGQGRVPGTAWDHTARGVRPHPPLHHRPGFQRHQPVGADHRQPRPHHASRSHPATPQNTSSSIRVSCPGRARSTVSVPPLSWSEGAWRTATSWCTHLDRPSKRRSRRPTSGR